ncbi:hypothetical protein GZH53_15720 [Flavihumibacter sp. R14]|nr:hypothetical protein [Flavihumibacter soli]
MYDEKLVNVDSANAELKKRIKLLLVEFNLSNLFVPFVHSKKELGTNDNYIKMYSSYKYITAKQKEFLVPKFIVHKKNWQTPYYYSYFIARKQPSRFNTFNDFKTIKKIYLQDSSMSGYYAALYRFWEMGLIKNPSVRSLQDDLHKDVIICKNSKEVIDSVSIVEYSMGATGEESFGDLNVEVKLVNMVLPQDVICISKNLIPYETKLNDLIFKLFSDTSLIRNPLFNITRLEPFTQTYLNSYNHNESIIKIVDSTKNNYSTDVYMMRVIGNEKIDFDDIINFIGRSELSVFMWILGIFLSVYTFGYNTGHIFLPLLSKAKKIFEKPFTYKGDEK